MLSKICRSKKNNLFVSQNVRCFSEIKSNQYNNIDAKYIDQTNQKLINTDYGINQFIKKTYLWTSTGTGISTGIGILGSKIIQSYPHLVTSLEPLIFSSFGLGLGGILGIGLTKYTTHTINVFTRDKTQAVNILYSINSLGRIISYGCLISAMGFIMIPIYTKFHDALLPAFIASSTVFGGSTWYILTRKVGELKQMKCLLYGGLTGLVSLNFISLGSNYVFGHNLFGDTTHLIGLYGGLPLFAGLIAYDTSKLIEMYKSGNPDHLRYSVELYRGLLGLVSFSLLVFGHN